MGLRLVSSAGEALPAEIGERFKRHFGVDIVDGIGSTEMLHIFISNRPDKVRYGSTGWPVPGYDIELRGEDGRAAADGEPGDLYIHGPSAALMYWGNRAKTRETFEGRWTRSGDKYIRNADGTFTYAGRSDDMLKVGGVWVSPFEVEATLVQHPSVLEAAVIGAPDADGLVKSKAFVVLKEGASADEAELKGFVKDRLAPYKYPRAIAFIAELPKTATGKIQRFRLREQEQSAENKAAISAAASTWGRAQRDDSRGRSTARRLRSELEPSSRPNYASSLNEVVSHQADRPERVEPARFPPRPRRRRDSPDLSSAESRTTNPSPDRVLASAGWSVVTMVMPNLSRLRTASRAGRSALMRRRAAPLSSGVFDGRSDLGGLPR